MKPIINIPEATVAAVREIIEADAKFWDLLAEAEDNQTRPRLLSAVMADPSQANLTALAEFDQRREVLVELAGSIRSGRVNPQKESNARFRMVIEGPLLAALGELEAELETAGETDRQLAEQHGQPLADSYATAALRERIEALEQITTQVRQGDANPKKLMLKLGYSFDGSPVIDVIGNIRDNRAVFGINGANLGIASRIERKQKETKAELREAIARRVESSQAATGESRKIKRLGKPLEELASDHLELAADLH